MRHILGKIKKHVASIMKDLIVGVPMPLAWQTWAIKHLLPMDPWPKSLAQQQCMADRIIASHGAVTQSGPFKGMVCLRDANEGCLVPKLLGCYEEELELVVEDLIKGGYDRVIDVGCASGYWLTGLAIRMPSAELVGFDMNKEALARCSELLTLNKVRSRVTLLGACTTAELERLIKGRTLVFMDCDGPEYELLDPQAAPALSNADIIVECHDFLNPRITPALLHRFKGSHVIRSISSRPRKPNLSQYPGLKVMPQDHWGPALDEHRPPQDWLVMQSRQLHGSQEVSDASEHAFSHQR